MPGEKPLNGKTALVTGGSRGIGRAISLKLAKLGARIAFTYRKNREAAEETARLLREAGIEPHVYQADLGDPRQLEELASRVIGDLGPVDVLVNNAGVGYAQPFHKSRPELLVREIQVDLIAPILLTRAFLPYMMDRGWGRIINISSIAGTTGALYLAVYSAAKAGIIGFTKSLAAELAPTGVTVNTVAPGFVATKLGISYFKWLEEAAGVKDALKRYLESIPPKRLVSADEVAEVVGFLASPEASGVTGQVIIVDAGASLSPGGMGLPG